MSKKYFLLHNLLRNDYFLMPIAVAGAVLGLKAGIFWSLTLPGMFVKSNLTDLV